MAPYPPASIPLVGLFIGASLVKTPIQSPKSTALPNDAMVIYSSTFPPLRANTPRVELFTPDPPLLEVPVPNEVALPVDANVTKSNLVY